MLQCSYDGFGFISNQNIIANLDYQNPYFRVQAEAVNNARVGEVFVNANGSKGCLKNT